MEKEELRAFNRSDLILKLFSDPSSRCFDLLSMLCHLCVPHVWDYILESRNVEVKVLGSLQLNPLTHK